MIKTELIGMGYGYSDKVCVPENAIFTIPETLSFEMAAAIPVNYRLIRPENWHLDWIFRIVSGNIVSI